MPARPGPWRARRAARRAQAADGRVLDLTSPGTTRAVGLLIAARGVRAFADGLVSVVLPAHLLALGMSAFEIGAIFTATLVGAAIVTLGIGLYGGAWSRRAIALWGCVAIALTGAAMVPAESFWLILLLAVVGTLNPSVGDVGMFLPMEQARLADIVENDRRTTVFARYSLVGALAGAAGTLSAPVPEMLGIALRFTFLLYIAVAVVLAAIYSAVPLGEPPARAAGAGAPALSAQSRRPILILTSLFCLDAFGGGFVLQSLLALWLFDRFDLSVADAARALFVMGVLGAFSHLAAPWVARRLGIINTMVFTHLPANLFLMATPFAPTLEIALVLLFLRSALSSMDVAPRTSLIVLLVPPHERAAATSVAAVPRSLAAAGAPVVAGALLAATPFGWSLVVGGALKALYDVLLLVAGRRLARERGVRDFR